MHPKRLAAMLLALCSLFFFVTAPYAQAAPESTFGPVQVFDVKAGKVVLTVPNDKQFQEYASSWIGSISGLAPQLTNDESCSYVYRIPLEKPTTIAMNGLNFATDEVFLFHCDGKPPLLLVFDDKRRPFLLLFTADIKPFVQKIGLPAA